MLGNFLLVRRASVVLFLGIFTGTVVAQSTAPNSPTRSNSRTTKDSDGSILTDGSASSIASGAAASKTTKDSDGSLPLWAQGDVGARQNLAGFVHNAKKGVVLVGHPEKGGHGTGWVISRANRLVVTNAHVADLMHDNGGELYAMLNTTAQVYKVRQAWYHPGLRRKARGETQIVVRSMDPRDGEVYPSSPDVAILQLENEGPDLPFEFPTATPDELDDLFAEPAAIMGYPGHDTRNWPKPGGRAQASFVDGVISRVTDFQFSTDGPDSEKQFLQYTLSTWGGFSGSPVFLSNGHVVAAHNMARTEKSPRGDSKSIPHGIRIDCVWELLVHHHLEELIQPAIDKSSINLARWLVDDPRELAFHQAERIVDEAENLVYNKGDLAAGSAKCKEALDLCPQYSRAYYVRANASIQYWFKYRRQITYEQGSEQLVLAAKFADKYVELANSDVKGYVLQATLLNNLGAHSENHEFNEQALKLANKLLEVGGLADFDRASLLSTRGVALHNLDEEDRALADHNAAIKLCPKEPSFLETRAEFWHYNGREDLEQQDYAAARKLRAAK